MKYSELTDNGVTDIEKRAYLVDGDTVAITSGFLRI